MKKTTSKSSVKQFRLIWICVYIYIYIYIYIKASLLLLISFFSIRKGHIELDNN